MSEYLLKSEEYLNTDLDSAFFFAEKARKLAKNIDDKRLMALSYEALGKSFFSGEEPDSATNYFELVLNHGLQSGDSSMIAKSYYHLGMTRQLEGNFANALQAYELGSHFVREEKSKINGDLLNGIGLVYSRLNDSTKAYEFFHRSILISTNIADTLGLAATHNNLGNLFVKYGDFRQARHHFANALDYYSIAQNNDGIRNSTVNLGNVFFQEGNIDLADSLYKRSSFLLSKKGVGLSLASLSHNFGSLYGLIKNFKKAEYYFKKALIEVKDLNKPDLIKSIHYNLGQVYELQSQHQKANEHYREHIFIQDTLHRNLQKTATLARQLQKQNLQMRLEKEQAQAQSVRMELANRNLTIGIILGIVFLLIGIGWFFLRLRNRQRQSAFESRIDRMMQEQEQHMFGAVIRGQEQAYSQIAQELHDNIGMLLSATNLHFSNLEEKLDTQLESFQQAKSTLLKAVKEVRTLSRDMLSGTLHHLGLVDAVEELLEVLRQTGQYEIDFETQGLAQVDLPPTMSHSLYRCVQELVSNVIRHSHADHIRLSIICKQGQLSLEFEDNGIGFDLHEPKAGMGIKSLSARVSDLQGTFDVQSEIGQGTLVKILLDVPESRSEWISGQSSQKQE